MLYLVGAVPYVLCCLLIGVWAHKKGHSGVAAALGAAFFSPIVMAIIVALVKDLRAEKERRSHEMKMARMIRDSRRGSPPMQQPPTVLCAACGANNWLGQPACVACSALLPPPPPSNPSQAGPRAPRLPQPRNPR